MRLWVFLLRPLPWQGLRLIFFEALSARLKSCLDTKHEACSGPRVVPNRKQAEVEPSEAFHTSI
jgi:hypothetical protein